MKKIEKQPQLTPYDLDLVAMIEGLTKTPVKVLRDSEKNQFQLYWDSVIEKDSESTDKMQKAIINAIIGRSGERYKGTQNGKTNITSIEFSPESWPTEKRFEIGPVMPEKGNEYISTVKAIRYKRFDVNRLGEFVGGGIEITSPDEKSSTFSFANQDGVWMHVNENDYVVLQNGCFHVIPEKEFEKQFNLNE